MTASNTPKTYLQQVLEHISHVNPSWKATDTGEEIFRRSWAKMVATFESLPEAFQTVAGQLMLDKNPFPYVILTPTFEGFLKRENEKLVFCQDQKLFILEKEQQRITTTSYQLENIYRIEFGEILLKAWVHIYGTNDQGQFSSTQLCFNSVTDFLFKPIIEAIRTLNAPIRPVDIQQKGAIFSPLKEKHFKFMNYARKSLLPGERVEQYIFQPVMETDLARIFGITLLKRIICLNHILILTERELILIREEATNKCLKDGCHYGGIWNYIPLNYLQDLRIEDISDGLVELTMMLPAGDSLKMPFANERRPELEQFVDKIKSTARNPVVKIL
jgi:hypothetical protein